MAIRILSQGTRRVAGPEGLRLSPSLFLAAWGGMTPGQIDCHVYAIEAQDGSRGLVLIDAGTTWSHQPLLAELHRHGYGVEDVKVVLLTHAHPDHAPGGYLFKDAGAEIVAHPETAMTAELIWESLLRTQGRCEAPRVDTHLQDGAELVRLGVTFDAMHTPGHSPGCMSYRAVIDGDAVLFSGDVLMSDGNPGWAGDPGYHPDKIAAACRKLLGQPFEHLCHGHDVLWHDHGSLFAAGLQRHADGLWPPPSSLVQEMVL